MELFWEMLSLQGTLFLLILAGVLAKKTGIVSETGRKTLSDLLIYIVLPCNILESFLSGGQMPEGFVRNCLLAVGISAGIQLLAVYGSKLLFRKYPRGEKSVRLSAKEFDVMRALLQAGSANLSKEAILARVWGYDSNATENHVEVYVGFLRKKLASIGSNIRITAIRRLGYHLEVDGPC